MNVLGTSVGAFLIELWTLNTWISSRFSLLC